MSDELNGHSVCLVCLDDEDLIFSLIYNQLTTDNTVRSSKNNTKKAKRALDGLRVSNSGNAPKAMFAISFQVSQNTLNLSTRYTRGCSLC